MDERVRESRLRRVAERREFKLRAASHQRPDRYMLRNADTQKPILGGSPLRYSATLDDIARYLVG